MFRWIGILVACLMTSHWAEIGNAQSALIRNGADLKESLERLVNVERKKTIHVMEGTYPVRRPIFLSADEVEIYGHGAVIVKQVPKHPLLYNLCSKFTLSGFTIDYNRPLKWEPYSSVIGLNVPPWLAKSEGWKGPQDVYRTRFDLLNNRFIDSNDRRKPEGEHDNWIVVTNTQVPGNNFTVRGNVLSAKDCEFSGGTWGFENVVFDNNHLYGGRTTGGTISFLSRYEGNTTRFVRNATITNNVIYHLHRYGITFGHDSKHPKSLVYDTIRIEGNIGYLAADCDKFARLVTFKLRNFDGHILIRDNLIDGSAVPPDAAIVPRDVVATNELTRGQTSPTGTLIWFTSRYVYPKNASWKFVDAVKSAEFGTLKKYLPRGKQPK